MAEWMDELILLAEAEYHARRIVATLATLDVDGVTPRARTVFVRWMDARTNDIWISTDLRSAKVPQLRANPRAELCFWTPHERQQFRIGGRIEIVTSGQMLADVWQQMSDAARALFFWPQPGAPRRPGEKFPAAVSAATAAPEHFAILVLHPDEAETLELNDTPHRRRCWRAANNWQVELINP